MVVGSTLGIWAIQFLVSGHADSIGQEISRVNWASSLIAHCLVTPTCAELPFP